MARAGASRADIAAEFQVSTQTAGRLVKAGGARVKIPGGKKIGKKPQYLTRVLELHDGGSTVGQIVDEVGDIHSSTAGEWLRESGRTPRYDGDMRVPARVEDHPMRKQAIRRYLDGETGPAVSKSLELSERTVEYWAKQDGVWGQGGIRKRQQEASVEAVRRYRAGEGIAAIIAASRESGSRLDFYQVRMALDEAGALPYPDDEKPDVWCTCGKKTGHPGRAYCSPEHRREYGVKRQADPDNQITFICARPACGKVMTVPRSYASAKKYCSNECSAKHNRTKQHIVVDDAIVLDSPWEALIWGLLRMWKIPVERADREMAVQVSGDGWYCPDFYLTGPQLWVEVKGYEDEDDRGRYASWRAAGRTLAVLRREHLDVLRVLAQGTQAVAYLEDLAYKAARP
jgi:hypothetical protein